jgi:hypothetical protein
VCKEIMDIAEHPKSLENPLLKELTSPQISIVPTLGNPAPIPIKPSDDCSKVIILSTGS